MKSVACLSSVRAACQHTAACLPHGLPLVRAAAAPLTALGRSATGGDSVGLRSAVVQQPLHGTRVNAAAVVVRQVSAAAARPPMAPGRRDHEVAVYRLGGCVGAAPQPSQYSPYTKPRSRVDVKSLFEGDVIPELCSRLAGLPSSERTEGLATLLGACAEYGLDSRSPLVRILIDESLQLLGRHGGDVGLAQLCHLGEVAYTLEGRSSAVLAEVLNSVGFAVAEGALGPGEAVGVYSLLALCHDPASRRQSHTLSALHRQTQRLVHRLRAGQVSDILQLLVKFQQRQAISLVLRLSHRASRVFRAFSDDEVVKVLSALTILGQHDEELLAAMEEHLPGRLEKCDPDLISTVMEYCLQTRCRSKPIFEAVAEDFVRRGEKHTTLQIAKQVIAMGRLNYLPQCSSHMFKKLESILSTRFSQFQPRSLIEVLHACIHLERIPLNHLSRVFSPYFLQRLQVQGEPLDRNALGQLTQLHLATSLECDFYWGPRLPYFLHVKKFSSMDQAFETPMDSLLYKLVRGPLTELLGGNTYSTRTATPCGYTVDVEICLDEGGLVLPPSLWEHTHRRMALCLDGQSRFCNNTHHLLGKEATKRRHLRRMGYEVVQIPYYEFERLRTSQEQVEYLHNKIFPIIFKFSHKF
ncbi:FAST kinase domain-containing protein 3, mitochondrial-like [Nelusetta ayraudi]|uniref:FAST kinase domain-containing protein 3, mitochondrial-like n=1 Tax=Nelusetta ayraudi TaxID=303726 RepID=UPI003F7151EA